MIPHAGVVWTPIYWPGWSIGYEIFFYAMMASAMIVSARYARHLCFFAIVIIAATAIPVPWKPGFHFQSEWGLEFASGLLLSMLVSIGLRVDRLTGALCLLLALAGFIANAEAVAVGYTRMIELGAPSVMLVVGATAFEDADWLRGRFARWAGDASYSIYLCHVTVIEAIREFGTIHGYPASAHPIIYFIATLFGVVAVGLLVNRWIERPMLHRLRSKLLPLRLPAARQPASDKTAAVVSHSA